MVSEGFNEIKVWELSRPVNHNDIIIWKPGCGHPGGMFWVIVLLKIPLPLFDIQFFKALHHSLIQNFKILVCIHLLVTLYKLSHTIPAHIIPYHKVIYSSMFDCGCSGLIRWGFTFLFPHIHFSVWSNLIDFSLITSSNPLFFSSFFSKFILHWDKPYVRELCTCACNL